VKNGHRALAVIVTVIWGVNFVVIEAGLQDVPPLVLTALRFVASALPLVFVVPRPTAKLRYVIGYGLVLGVVKFGLLFTAMAHGMPAGLASLVLQLQALFSLALAAVLIRERPGTGQILGVILATAGMGLLATGGVGRFSAIGFLLTVGAAAAWAVANVVVRASGETRPLSLLVWSSLVPPVPLLGLSALVDGPSTVAHALTHLTGRDLLCLAYVAYLSTLVGFGLWNRLIARYSVSRIAPFSLLVPVFGLAAAWLVDGEALTWRLAACAALVLAGLGLVVHNRSVAASREAGSPMAEATLQDSPMFDGAERR
jgi:O-acetylserine/cysteine efflux transporter